MDRTALLGASFLCDCGKNHHVPTREAIYSDDALDKLADCVKAADVNGGKYLIIADKRTYNAAGQTVKTSMQKVFADVSVFIVEDSHGDSPVADDLTKNIILKMAPEADLYIAVGSGVINDLVKWVSFLRQKPYITVPTAASMNGYASANVAASIDGLKVLFHAQPCIACVVSPQVLVDAPYELTSSGLGDVLAKSVSSADWKLNHYLFDEYFCQFSVDLLKDLEPIYLNNPEKIKSGQPESIQALFDALFYSSIAMTITGTSSPASGGEHLISHTLDMLADRDGRKHDLHGRQVGVASILMAALYERIMNIDTPVFFDYPRSIDTKFWGALAPVVEKQYVKKAEKFDRAAAILSNPEYWKKLRDEITPGLVSPVQLKNCLQQAGGAHVYSDIRDNHLPLEKDKFLQVVTHAHQMRERFTILDLAVILGIIPNEIEELIAAWVS